MRALIVQAPSPVHYFVVDSGAMTDIDYSAARSLLDLCADLKTRKIKLVFGRVNAYLRADMDRHGLVLAIGEKFIFSTLHEALSMVDNELKDVNVA